MANGLFSRLLRRRRAQPPDPDDETLRESMSTVGLKGQGIGTASSQFTSPVYSDIAPSKAELEQMREERLMKADIAKGAQWRWDKYGNKIPTGESIGSAGQYLEYKTRE